MNVRHGHSIREKLSKLIWKYPECSTCTATIRRRWTATPPKFAGGFADPRHISVAHSVLPTTIITDSVYQSIETGLEEASVKVVEKCQNGCQTLESALSTFQVLLQRSRDENYLSRQPTRVPLLNARHRAARLAWAREHRDWNLENWKRVAWSDESRF
ncbi:hypothetical protein TNCV_2282191 [Trichonephila clavipes]|nr:hypothetical protein TNCV_2282191 [Trichonephila clavipes]